MSTESNTTETIRPKPKPGALLPPKAVQIPKAVEPPQAVRPPKAAPTRRVVTEDDDEDEGSSGRTKIIIGLVLLAAVGGVVFAAKQFSTSGPAPQKQEMQMVAFIPPPPPPPPPPKATPPPEVVPEKKQMIVQDEIKEPEEKPDDKPQPPAAPQMSTGIKGPGGDSSLGGSGTGNSFGGPPKKRGSQFGWYAGPVQNRVADALRNNRATRTAKLDGVLVKIWPDSNAKISRVEFKTGSGQPAVDDAIRQALFGLSLDAPPPADMPLPIVLRLSAKTGFTAQR